MTDRPEELVALVGETRATIEGLRVEAGKVEEFARALYDDDPIYRDRAAARARGFSDTPAPLTFTRTGRFPRYRTGEAIDLGFRHEYTLHGAQAYEYERLPVVGDRLRGETTLVDVTEREGKRGGAMTFVELETVYFDADDEQVLSERATVIETDGAVADDEESPTADAASGESATVGDRDDGSTPDDRDRDRPLDDGVSPDTPNDLDASAPNPARAGGLAVGDRAPEVTVGPLERQDFVRYAGASGDFNPIHYDEPYARRAGNPSVFGQGMFTAGAVADWLGIGNIETFAVRFRSRVWPGDRIAASAEVTDIGAPERDGSEVSDGNDGTGVESRDGERVECDLWVERDGGETVLTGRAIALLEG